MSRSLSLFAIIIITFGLFAAGCRKKVPQVSGPKSDGSIKALQGELCQNAASTEHRAQAAEFSARLIMDAEKRAGRVDDDMAVDDYIEQMKKEVSDTPASPGTGQCRATLEMIPCEKILEPVALAFSSHGVVTEKVEAVLRDMKIEKCAMGEFQPDADSQPATLVAGEVNKKWRLLSVLPR